MKRACFNEVRHPRHDTHRRFDRLNGHGGPSDGCAVSFDHARNGVDLRTRSIFEPMPLDEDSLVRIDQLGRIKEGTAGRT